MNQATTTNIYRFPTAFINSVTSQSISNNTPTVKIDTTPEKPIPPENQVFTEGTGVGSGFEPACWEDLSWFTRATWCIRNWYKWRKCVDMGRAACHLIWSSNPQHAEIGEELWKLQDDMFEELFESWKNRK